MTSNYFGFTSIKELNAYLQNHPGDFERFRPIDYPAQPPKGALYEKDNSRAISNTHQKIASEFLFPLEDNWRTPDNVSAGCNKHVFFKCSECGRIWVTQISNRCKGGTGCPECAKALIKAEGLRKATPAFGEDLESKCPKACELWDYEANAPLTPKDVKFRSNQVFKWICPVCGNQWSASVNSIFRSISNGNNGCDKCRQKAVSLAKTTPNIGEDLESKCPKACDLWDYEANYPKTPKDVKFQSNKSAHWICPTCGYKWTASIFSVYRSITNGHNGCRRCRQMASVKARTTPATGNDLETLFPDLAKEWDYDENYPLTPKDVLAHSNKNAHWICPKCGNKWVANINSRARGNGCPKCTCHLHSSLEEYAIYYYLRMIDETVETGRYLFEIIPGIPKRDRLQADIFIPAKKTVIEYDGMVFHGSKESQVRDARKDSLLKSNGYRVIRIKENKDENCDVFLSKEDTIHYTTVNNYQDFNKVIQLLALSIYGIEITDIDFRRDEEKIQGLRVGKSVKNSIAEMRPNLAKEWSPNNHLSAKQVQYGSDTPYLWVCPIHGDYLASPANRNAGKGCPKCAGNKVFLGVNNIGHTNPELLKYWDFDNNNKIGRTPDNTAVNTKCGKIYWKCPICGNSWLASPQSMKQRKNKCLSCGKDESKTRQEEKLSKKSEKKIVTLDLWL